MDRETGLAAAVLEDTAGPGLLGRWRQQLNRFAPRVHVAADVSAFSLGDGVDTRGMGPSRFQPPPPALGAKPGAWSLKPASDFADLRHMLRSRTLQWQPLSVGHWQVGAAIGPVRALSSQRHPEPGAYALMPMVSYQPNPRTEWRMGVLPATAAGEPTFVVKLRLKAF
jgi:hypothetical protein